MLLLLRTDLELLPLLLQLVMLLIQSHRGPSLLLSDQLLQGNLNLKRKPRVYAHKFITTTSPPVPFLQLGGHNWVFRFACTWNIKRTLICAFQGHQPITEVDLHLVLEHDFFFSRPRAAKTLKGIMHQM